MAAKTKSPTKFTLLLNALVTGLQSSMPSTVKSLTLLGVSYTPASLLKVFQTFAAFAGQIDQAKTAWQALVTQRNQALTTFKPVLDAFVAWLKVQFGNDPATLKAFGVVVTKRAEPTATTKAIATAKRKATKAQKDAANPPAPSDSLVAYNSSGEPIGGSAAAEATSVPAASAAAAAPASAGSSAAPAAGK